MNNKQKKKTISVFIKVLGILLLVIVAVCAVAFGYLFSKLGKITYSSDKTEVEPLSTEAVMPEKTVPTPQPKPLEPEKGVEVIESSEAPEGDVFADKDIINILLIGSDAARGGPGDPGRADCTMLCSLNGKTGDVKLISFERGITVSFDVYPFSDILTHTYVWGGPELTTDIIRKYFLVDIAGYIHINYDIFIKGIDAIGGVDIDLTEKEVKGLNKEVRTNAVTKAEVHEGINHLDGHDALQYCRLRYIDSDWHRIERQRNTVQAALRAATKLSLKEINAIADELLPMIDTDLSKKQLTSLLFHAPKFIGATAGQMTVPVHTYENDPIIWCNFADESERIKEFLSGK